MYVCVTYALHRHARAYTSVHEHTRAKLYTFGLSLLFCLGFVLLDSGICFWIVFVASCFCGVLLSLSFCSWRLRCRALCYPYFAHLHNTRARRAYRVCIVCRFCVFRQMLAHTPDFESSPLRCLLKKIFSENFDLRIKIVL